jgi:two-component system response regulator ChvI
MPDLIVINLPTSKIDGVTLIDRLRAVSIVPVIMLSAARDEIDEIMGLRFGADDYIHTPVSPRLLAERIKGLLRRHSMLLAHVRAPEAVKRAVVCGNLVMDPSRHSVCWRDHEVSLTATEFQLLHALVRRPGIVKTRDQLLEASYPDETYVDDRIIDSHIKRIRKKLKVVDPQFSGIQTLYGVGYRFTETADTGPAAPEEAANQPKFLQWPEETADAASNRDFASWSVEAANTAPQSRTEVTQLSLARSTANLSRGMGRADGRVRS